MTAVGPERARLPPLFPPREERAGERRSLINVPALNPVSRRPDPAGRRQNHGRRPIPIGLCMILSFTVQETCILSPALLPLREEREGVSGQRSAGESGVLVDFPAMPDVMQVDSPLARIKFVKHPVVAHAQFELGTALQPLVGENVQPGSQVVHFTFHIGLNRIGQGVESAGKGGGPDLQGSRHGSPGVAGSEFTGRNFTAGFI